MSKSSFSQHPIALNRLKAQTFAHSQENLCHTVGEGPIFGLHSPSEAELKTNRVDAGSCCQSTGSSTYTGVPRYFLPCYKPLGYGWTMTSPKTPK